MNLTDKNIRTLREWMESTPAQITRLQEGLNRKAVSLVVIRVAKAWPSATELTVEFGYKSVRLVAVHEPTTTLWHAERDEPNTTSRAVDKVLAFAVEHGGLAPEGRPEWTAGAEVLTPGKQWDLPILESLAYPPGCGLTKPKGVRYAADRLAEAAARD